MYNMYTYQLQHSIFED